MVKKIIFFAFLISSAAFADASRTVTADQIQSSDGTKLWPMPPVSGTLLTSAEAGSSFWSLSGNAGTTAGTDFIGTTDAQDVVVKRNSVTKFTVGSAINVSDNVLQAPDGTVSAPGYRLTTDNDTGFYQTGDGNLSVAANGGQVASFDQGNFTATVKATTPSLQAPAASNLIVGTDAGTQMTFLQSGGWESSGTVVPLDATGKNQYDARTYASPTASTDGASNTNFYSQLVYDNPNAGFNNINGNMIASSSNFTHNGSGSINYASINSNSASFNNNGTTQQFKGVTSENGISSGATVSDYYGIVSGLSTTGGIVGSSQSISSYANFNDATIGQATGVNQSFTIDGTTTNSQGVTGLNSNIILANSAAMTNSVFGVGAGVDLNNSSSANGITGYNFQTNLRDTSSPGAINLFSAGLNQEDSVASTGTNGVNLNMQYSNTADGANVNGLAVYARTSDTAHLDSYNSLQTNPEFEGSSTVDNVTIINAGGQIRGSAVTQNVSGLLVNPQISGTAAATNFTGASISPAISDTATVTNGISGLQVSPSSVPLLSSASGVSINMGSVALSPSALAGGAQVSGLSVSDGAFSSNYNYTVPGAASFFQINYLGGGPTVASGAPTSAFGFGNNLAHTVTLHDDWNLDGAGLGFVDVGFVGALNFDPGTTMASWTGALGGAGNPGGAGTLTDAIMFRAAGILPQGGSLAVTNMYGFQVADGLFCIIGTNCWGIYENTAAAENHLSKLAIGTSTKKVANSSTALEIGSSKAFLNGRGSTATKNALTAVAGMQFYDTDLDELQYYDGSTWVATGGGGSGFSRVVASVSANTTVSTLTTDNILNVDTTGGAINVTLPDSVASNGYCIDVKNIGSPANNVAVTAFGGQTIDGSASDTITNANDSAHYCAVSGNWFIY